ncbi:hypothetical protein GXM_07157 [Nostoc sphaeroides CCNUC1]|uniref:Uncharacterized protein n=1 Tax=Nostoc sphaeroides CCNUC1 TaxID=2653204 RepID=A0A5P8WA41_9NOSO|nr:hypothetical protein GXM_07157 [Nostoc sphaeroides CCNUC1]
MPRWRRSQLSVGLERSLGFITTDRLGEPLLIIYLYIWYGYKTSAQV